MHRKIEFSIAKSGIRLAKGTLTVYCMVITDGFTVVTCWILLRTVNYCMAWPRSISSLFSVIVWVKINPSQDNSQPVEHTNRAILTFLLWLTSIQHVKERGQTAWHTEFWLCRLLSSLVHIIVQPKRKMKKKFFQIAISTKATHWPHGQLYPQKDYQSLLQDPKFSSRMKTKIK